MTLSQVALSGCAVPQWPIENAPMTSAYGMRWRSLLPEVHRGVDFGVPEGTAKTRLRRARQLLEQEMEKLAAQMYAAGELLGLLTSDPEEWFAGDVDGELSADDIEAMIEGELLQSPMSMGDDQTGI